MATTKRFIFSFTPGAFPVLVLRKASNGYLRDDLDGVFRAHDNCTTPYLAMTEDADLPGLFTAAITGEVFADDIYTALFFASSAMDEAPVQTRTREIRGDYTTDPGGAVALVEYALCSLQQVKTEMVITGTAEDDRISRAINDGTDRLETILKRRVVKRAASSVEYHDRPWKMPDGTQVLWPSEYPIESTSDVTSVEAGSATGRTALTLTYMTIYQQRVLVFPSGGIATGSLANKLTFRPGYTTCPHDLQGVAISLAQRLYWDGKRQEAGDTEQTVGGVSRRKDPLAFSVADQLIIDAYTRKESGVWPRGTEWMR